MTSDDRRRRFSEQLPPELRKRSFTVAEARARGVGRGKLQNSALGRPFRGVRVDEQPTPEFSATTRAEAVRQRLRAHDLAYSPLLRPSTAFGVVSAARILGLPLPLRLLRDPRVHVLAPEGVNIPRRPGVVTRILPRRQWRTMEFHGVQLPHPALLYCLAARDFQRSDSATARSEVLTLGDALVSTAKNYPNRRWRGALTRPEELDRAVSAWSPAAGVALLREMTPHIHELVESPYETLMRFVLHESGYPKLTVQHSLRVDGREVARLDCADLDARIAYEFDGLGHLQSPTQWRRDVRRPRLLHQLGWHAERLTVDDLWPDPSAFVRHAHELRRRRLG